ncbi:polyprenyl synthetase family protein [Robertkochia aurantiaca]|uniref:polyprenyl synthetase family protein n=1 Tax=Robertkochia aurantiaca TaxID=2873700 RepID=UPI001CCE10CA|nr:polyprenyl synthetase family protein [Robertkochia sp. 3YJGBD-33]
MLTLTEYREVFTRYLDQNIARQEPLNLYEPMVYIMNLGGKRIRPSLTLMACEMFGSDYQKALNAALAVEVFHNFSLVHDDIMDDAPLRRGKETVHEKWDINTGILSGDVMLIKAYQLFENYEPEIFRQLAALFSKTAVEVCEGQQYDMDFENRDDVSIGEYLKMITYKTAVLLAAALKMGAIIGGASPKNAESIYAFGLNLGIAFQLKDDYLDAFGDPEKFGKQVGGDIIENKKTYLYLKAIEMLPQKDADQLKHLYTIAPADPEQKIISVKELVTGSGADRITLEAIESYTQKALDILDSIECEEDSKSRFRDFAQQLMTRKV